MRKLLSFLLATALLASSAGCGNSSGGDSSVPGTEPLDSAKQEKSTEPTPEAPQAQKLSLSGANTVEGIVEYSIATAYATTEVMPPKPDSWFTYYEADSGKIFVVLLMDVKNLGSASAECDDLLDADLDIGGTVYGMYGCLTEVDDGQDLEQYEDIDPLATSRVYCLFSVPEDSVLENMTLTVTAGEDIRAVEMGIAQFESSRKTITLGEEITDGETLSLTVDDIYFSTLLNPPRATGYYHYYEADSGKTFLIVKMSITNLKGTDLKYSSVAGVSCVYNEKYNYSAFGVLEKDGGEDLNGYPGQYSISPLDSGVMYFLAEVPAEVETGTVEVSVYILGEYYTYTIGQ